jgi:hypothetical protein
MTPQAIQELVDDFGQQAQEAYATKGHWRYQPQDCGGEDAWASSCSDCEQGWHQYYYPVGYEIEDGTVYQLRWSVDEDGNWDLSDTVALDSEEYDFSQRDYTEEKRQAGWTEYYREVERTGKDPLGAFFVAPDRKETWAVVIVQAQGHCFLLRARAARKGAKSYIGTAVPERIREFFQCNDQCVIEGEEFRTLGQLAAVQQDGLRWMPHRSATLTGYLTLDMPRPPAALRREARRLASKALLESTRTR